MLVIGDHHPRASPRSRNAHQHVTTATLCGNLQEKCSCTEPRRTLCTSLRSQNAHQHVTRATLYGHLQEKCLSSPESVFWAQDSRPCESIWLGRTFSSSLVLAATHGTRQQRPACQPNHPRTLSVVAGGLAGFPPLRSPTLGTTASLFGLKPHACEICEYVQPESESVVNIIWTNMYDIILDHCSLTEHCRLCMLFFVAQKRLGS